MKTILDHSFSLSLLMLPADRALSPAAVKPTMSQGNGQSPHDSDTDADDEDYDYDEDDYDYDDLGDDDDDEDYDDDYDDEDILEARFVSKLDDEEVQSAPRRMRQYDPTELARRRKINKPTRRSRTTDFDDTTSEADLDD